MSLFDSAYVASHAIGNSYIASIYNGVHHNTCLGMRQAAYTISEIVPECIEEEKIRLRQVERASKTFKIRVLNRVKSSIFNKKLVSKRLGSSKKRLWSNIRLTKKEQKNISFGYSGYIHFYCACMAYDLTPEQSKWVSIFLTMFKEDGTIVSVSR